MTVARRPPCHLVYGLGLADGNVMPGFPIDAAVELATRRSNFSAVAQNQRGALTLLNGSIYRLYGNPEKQLAKRG